jgi:hypothetical protein
LLDSFIVLRKYEERDHGEFRTKRIILEIYDDMNKAMSTDIPYQTRVKPPPGPPEKGMPKWKSGNPKPEDWPSNIHIPRE